MNTPPLLQEWLKEKVETFRWSSVRESRAIDHSWRRVTGPRAIGAALSASVKPSENGEISLLTFMVYLNAGYEGGATRFEAIKVNGKAGMALIFQHGLVHEGAEVSHGIKYALRSDVMFGALERVGG